MVLRLFSRSSSSSDSADKKSAAKQAAPQPQVLPATATTEERVAAVRNAGQPKERQALIKDIADPKALRDLAQEPDCLAACADRLASLESIDSALELVRTAQSRRTAQPADSLGDAAIQLALHTHNNELRSAQIDALNSEQSLVALEHASRSKNKTCNRLARARLDALRSARVQCAEATAETLEIAQHAERLEVDAYLSARYDALAQKHQRASEHHAQSSALLRHFGETAQALAVMPKPPSVVVEETVTSGPDFSELATRFGAFKKSLIEGIPAKDIAMDLARAASEWREAIAQATPDAQAIEEVSSCSQLYESVRSCETLLEERKAAISELLQSEAPLKAQDIQGFTQDELHTAWQARELAHNQTRSINELTKNLRYPGAVKQPDLIAALEARRSELAAVQRACAEKQKPLETSFDEQINQLDKAIKSGELKKAESARAQAFKLQDALPGDAARGARKRFGSLIASMQNLRDWQHFATDPKREELCEKMQALAMQPKEPDEQADLVKELRSQWNALGGKGPKELASRFDDAAARAFEPCRQYYAELAQTREENLNTRKQILAQVEGFVNETNWANIDLINVRKILDSARSEWRAAFPVERNANKKLEKRFQSATDDLYARLKDGWGENLAAKEKLVLEAQALLDSEEALPARLDAAKQLQVRWKETGPAPRGPDQKLWKKFRTACDALFNARDEERSAQQAQYADNQTKANARLQEFAQILETTEAAELDRSLLSALKQDLDQVEHLDREIISKLRTLEDRFKAKLALKAAAQKIEKLALLRALDTQAATAELNGEAVAQEVVTQDALFAERRLAEANAHLDLVIEAESQAGIDSPASDAQRRMELQVQRLNAGMNSGARQTLGALEFARQWCGLQATNDSQALRSRLFAAAEKLLAP